MIPGFLGIPRKIAYRQGSHVLGQTHDVPVAEYSCLWDEQDYLFSLAVPRHAVQVNPGIFRRGEWIGFYYGDMTEHDAPPWDEIIAAVNGGDRGFLATLEGAWALALIDTAGKRLFLVSDRRSQQPLFYSISDAALFFSTSVASLCMAKPSVRFNPRWLHELLFFHFPVGSTTFLEGVYRLPAASILCYSPGEENVRVERYAEDFARSPVLYDTKESIGKAAEIFSQRFPKYAPAQGAYAAAVTGGWDARTVLAYTMSPRTVTYTYGMPGCGDLRATRDMARKLGMNHREIYLDDRFLAELPSLMYETVFLSDGLENCFRASLLYVYRTLTDNGREFPVTLSGIGLDSMFRGHLGPALVSPDMATLFRGGEVDGLRERWADIMVEHGTFWAHVTQVLDEIRSAMGPLALPETHLRYFVYEIATKYYGGEKAVAQYFTTLRIPALDSEVVRLAFRASLSALSFSNFLATHTRGDYSEEVLQAHLLARSPVRAIGDQPINHIPPRALLYGRGPYNVLKHLYKTKGRLLRVLKGGRTRAVLEANVDWFTRLLHEQVTDLLYGKESRIRSYVNVPPLEMLATDENQHLMKKLLTAEIVMRLVETRWSRFW